MFQKLPSFQRLVRKLQKVPFLASKNLYKVAIYFLTQDAEETHKFCDTLMQAKKNIKTCLRCYNFTESLDGICSICGSDKRDKSIICVVETWHDLFAIEKIGDYQGIYHVLGGTLCPLEGIGPDDLNIESLFKRIDKTTQEIIFATNPTPEGEATSSYIACKLSDLNFKLSISKLASGVPTGSSLEYMDRITIHKALSGRRPF
ncbi:recombination protein RecR [Candidatus Dependentiae bacterium]|nr:recombination protein RecR [Candidatus Dependentiae bacterium]